MSNELRKIKIDDTIDMEDLFGNLDANLDIIKESTGVEIIQRDDCLLLKGEKPDMAEEILRELIALVRSGDTIDAQKVNYIVSLKESGLSYSEQKVSKDVICFTTKGKPIKPKTIGQKEYVNSIKNRDVVFAIGPAGTGKTYIAVAMAINAFKNKEVQKIILARPAVEAGENLGFLPGDLQEKVDPYLRPLYDGLYDILGRENATRLKEKEAIEVVPLAYMRGRTPGRRFHNTGRSSEHHSGADEDVLDQNGIRLQGSRYRRCDSDRPAEGQEERPGRGQPHSEGCQWHRFLLPDRRRRSAP